MKNMITMKLVLHERNVEHDIQVGEEISAYELVVAIDKAYDLGIDTNDITQCYLKTENPIALIKGDKLLKDYGLHDGTIINYTARA